MIAADQIVCETQACRRFERYGLDRPATVRYSLFAVAARRFQLLRKLRGRHLRTAVGVVLVALALALGGAHPQVNAILAVALVALVVVALLRRAATIGRTVPVTLVIGATALALVVTVFQIVPLPAPAIRVLSPGAYDLLTMSVGESFGWAPLSMDPPATYHEIHKLIACFCAAILGVTLYRTRRHRRNLAVWVSAAGGIVAMLGFLHALAGMHRPYGAFGRPLDVFVSSFVNPNHLAGFLGLCSVVALGLALSARDEWRWAHLANAIVMGAAVILTLSRGGIVAYVGALLLLGGLLALRRSDRIRHLFSVQLALAGVLLVAGYLAYSRIVSELWTLTGPDAFSKADIWESTPSMLAAFPALGIGRGAFSSVYPRYRLHDLPATFTHLENEWLQALVDWGPLVGSILVALVAVILFRLFRHSGERSDPADMAATAGLWLLAAHNLGDFNTTLSAVSLPAVFLAAALTRSEDKPASESAVSTEEAAATHDKNRRPFALLLLVLSLGCLAVLVMPAAIYHTAGRDTRWLRERLAAEPDPGQRRLLVDTVSSRHPADYLIPLIAAEHELSRPDGARRSLPLINRGMFLAPNYVGAHRLAGRALLALGARRQALDEYRLACEASPGSSRSILEEVWNATRSVDAVSHVGDSRPAIRVAAARLLLRHEAPERARTLAASGPMSGLPELQEILASASLQLDRTEAALSHARELQRRHPDRVVGYRLAAMIEERQGHVDEALATLERGRQATDRGDSLLAQKALILIRHSRLVEARKVVHTLLSRASSGAASARATWLLGQVYRREGRNALALHELERARDQNPSKVGYRIGIAKVREAIGDLSGAREELLRAQEELGSTPVLQRALRRLETLAAAGEEPDR